MNPDTQVSVIVPVRNGAATLPRCLDALLGSGFRDFELIVVDDGSDDGSGDLAAACGCTVIRHETRRGPAAARNQGARAAKGEILVFTDSDVVFPHDGGRRIQEAFAAHPEAAAVQGIYRSPGPCSNPASRYQNDYYHYFCRRIPGSYTNVFATWCAAVRRGAFDQVGGFDERIPDPTVEDEEFGYELVERDLRILLLKELQVDHLACYTWRTLLRRRFAMATSQMKSAIRKAPVRLFKRYANLGHNMTHHSRRILLAIPVAFLVAGSLPAAVFDARVLPGVLAAAATFLLLASEFLRFVARTHGWRALPATAALMWLDMLAVGAGLAAGAVGYARGKRY
ncbi:MAG: glycosyltransferase [Candidatus Eisenbacteria bacterium]|jgi:glycosyltransferase involved in cell wall biosynthesis|nr:glycosyltransferase [Candidatus Eisenbacteria bacterium]